jgi:hypothetical protein
MKRSYWIGLGIVVGLAGIAALGRERLMALVSRFAGREDAPVEKQWPFDSDELHSLMGRVVGDQRTIVANAESPAERERAAAFQRYYEGRLAAAR